MSVHLIAAFVEVAGAKVTCHKRVCSPTIYFDHNVDGLYGRLRINSTSFVQTL